MSGPAHIENGQLGAHSRVPMGPVQDRLRLLGGAGDKSVSFKARATRSYESARHRRTNRNRDGKDNIRKP